MQLGVRVKEEWKHGTWTQRPQDIGYQRKEELRYFTVGDNCKI